MIETEPDVSWLRDFAIPALFTLLGAAIGFISSQVRDEWNAKGDKQSFLRAIGMELDALGDQLDASFYEVKGAEERFKEYRFGPTVCVFASNSSIYRSGSKSSECG